MVRFAQRVWSFIAHVTQAWQLLLWLVPSGVLSAITGLLANAADVPAHLVILYILSAFCLCSVAVAAIFIALLRENEWHHRTSVEGKLDFIQPHFAVDVNWTDNGSPEFISKMNVGLTLVNRSLATIYYKVVSFHALVEGRGPNTDRYVTIVWPVLSQTTHASNPDPVDIHDLHKLDVKGTLDFEIAYGRSANDLRYTIK